jgi:hypothetical protein
MDMVGHQAPRMDFTGLFCSLFGQILKVEEVILFRVETGRTVISSLNQMQRDSWYQYTSSTRHMEIPFSSSWHLKPSQNRRKRGLRIIYAPSPSRYAMAVI